MRADKGIQERLDSVIVLEIETPEVRKRNDKTNSYLKSTGNVAIEWLILWIRNPSVDCKFHLLS